MLSIMGANLEGRYVATSKAHSYGNCANCNGKLYTGRIKFAAHGDMEEFLLTSFVGNFCMGGCGFASQDGTLITDGFAQ